jgi:hypothetical protein
MGDAAGAGFDGVAPPAPGAAPALPVASGPAAGPGEPGAEPLRGDGALAAEEPGLPAVGVEGDDGGDAAAPFSVEAGDPAPVPFTSAGAAPALPGAGALAFAGWALVAVLSLVPPEQAVPRRARIPTSLATRRPLDRFCIDPPFLVTAFTASLLQ